MTDHSRCLCGARLFSKAELLATGDQMDAYIAETYLDDDCGFCAEEDDVVPYRWLDQHERGEALR